eukprot:6490579-Amphidinium_carterae.1
MLLERSEPVCAQSPLSSLGANWVAAAALIAHLWNYILIGFFIGIVGATSSEFVDLIMREPNVMSLCVQWVLPPASSSSTSSSRSEPVSAQSPLSSLRATWVAAAALIAHLWNYFLIGFFIGIVGAASSEFINLIRREPNVMSLCVRVLPPKSSSSTSSSVSPASCHLRACSPWHAIGALCASECPVSTLVARSNLGGSRSADHLSLELHPLSLLHWKSGCYLQRVRQSHQARALRHITLREGAALTAHLWNCILSRFFIGTVGATSN